MNTNDVKIEIMNRKQVKLSPKSLKIKNLLKGAKSEKNPLSKWQKNIKNKTTPIQKTVDNKTGVKKFSPQNPRITKVLAEKKISKSSDKTPVRKINKTIPINKTTKPENQSQNQKTTAPVPQNQKTAPSRPQPKKSPNPPNSTAKKNKFSRRGQSKQFPNNHGTTTPRTGGRSLERWPNIPNTNFPFGDNMFNQHKLGHSNSRGALNNNLSSISNRSSGRGGAFRGSNYQVFGPGGAYPGMKPPSVGLFNNHFSGSGGYFGGRGNGFW